MKKKIIFLSLLIFNICFALISCKKGIQLSGIYRCEQPGNKSYFQFLPHHRVKYQDNHVFPTLYLFRYSVHNNKLRLFSEQGQYDILIVDENTLEVDKSWLFFKARLIYRRSS